MTTVEASCQSHPEVSAIDISCVDDLFIESSPKCKSSLNFNDSLRNLSTGNLSTMSNVSFGTIEIQEYPMVLGDNPSTSHGPSVELDWEVTNKLTIENLDQYEALKPPRRELNQLLMSSEVRTKLLIDNGHSMCEIRETTQQRYTLRRKKSNSNKKFPTRKLLTLWK